MVNFFVQELTRAIVAGEHDRVAELIKVEDINQRTKGDFCSLSLEQATPLIWAAACKHPGHEKIVADLIGQGADVNAQAGNGYSALIYSAKFGNYENVDNLIKNGVDLEQFCKCGKTAIMWTAGEGYYDVTELLIKAGANVNVSGKTAQTMGKTPLILARKNGHSQIEQLLIKHGAKH